MTSWVSVSFGVVEFGMMPSVGGCSSCCTTATPPFASRQRGSEGASALERWPRLEPEPGNDSNARFASESQSFLRGRRKFLATVFWIQL